MPNMFNKNKKLNKMFLVGLSVLLLTASSLPGFSFLSVEAQAASDVTTTSVQTTEPVTEATTEASASVTTTQPTTTEIQTTENTEVKGEESTTEVKETVDASSSTTKADESVFEESVPASSETSKETNTDTTLKTGETVEIQVVKPTTYNSSGATNYTLDADIDGCTASQNGGAIYNSGTIEIKNTTINECSATDGSGGAIYNTGTLTTFTDSTLNNNTAANGGAVYNSGTVTTNNVVFHTNTATTSGGGVYNAGGTFTMPNGSVYSNKAANGAGIFNNAGTTKLTGIKLYSNTASQNGGAVYNNATLTISSTPIYSNAATSGSGGGIYQSAGTLTLGNEFVYGNTNTGVHVNGGTATLNGGKFGLSAYTNESTYTVSRNTGSQITVGASGSVTINTANAPRIVSTLASGEAVDANKGIVNNGTVTVSNASTNALYLFGTGTSIHNNGTFTANVALKIVPSAKEGATTAQTKLGIKNDSSGKFYINNASSEISYCKNRGILNSGTLTMTQGSIHHCSSDNGAGVYNSGNATLTGTTLYSNTATTSGGAAYIAAGGTLNVSGGSIGADSATGNKATQEGGAVYNAGTFTANGTVINYNTAGTNSGGIQNSGTATITNGQLSYNTSTTKGGGGASNYGTLNISGTTVKGNKAPNDSGGGIYNAKNGKLVSTGVTYTENSAAVAGGALFFEAGALASTVTKNSTYPNGNIYSNTAKDGAGISNAITATGGLTVKDISIYSNTATNQGGAIKNYGTITVTNTPMSSNKANQGGAIYQTGNAITIATPSLKNNTATADGGAIYIASGKTLNVTNGEISGNLVSGEALGGGGAVYNAGTFTADATSIISNTSNGSGGAICNDGTATIKNMTMTKNKTGSYGGAVVSTGTLTSTNVVYTENEAQWGGAVANAGTATFSSGTSFTSNTATSGGAIYQTGGKITLTSPTIKSNSASYGGGIYIDTGNGEMNVTGGEISYNTSSYGGGGVVNYSTFNTSGTSISNNTATNGNGGAIYHEGNAITLASSKFLNNTSGKGGGAIYSKGGKITLTSPTITGNNAQWGGGVYIDTDKEMSVTGGSISSNTSAVGGGGIANFGVFNTSGTSINNNTATSGNGGAIHHEGDAITLADSVFNGNKAGDSGGAIYQTGGKVTLTNPTIQSNSAAYGGGLYIDPDKELAVTSGDISSNISSNGGGGVVNYGVFGISNTNISKNAATYGAGIYVEGDNATVKMSDGSINNNTAEYSGGGIFGGSNAQITVSGGTIYSNIANTSGGGVIISDGAILNLTSNSIYSNEAPTGSGVMVYDATSVLNMSGVACVGDTNRDGIADTDEIYLSDNAYISVPSQFTNTSTASAITTGKKALRAIVVVDSDDTARVIAKYTSTTTEKGSTALYWNASTPSMSEQYFTVNGKLLRSGDQGAAKVSSSGINNNDIFISEKYSVSFDMNPNLTMMTATIKHIVNSKEFVFDSLATDSVNKDVYFKYWNETLTFNPGEATCEKMVFVGWSAAKDGNDTVYGANTNITISTNGDKVIYALWDNSLVDVDYNGNGATQGENWTDKDVSTSDLPDDFYEFQGDKTSFERTELDKNTGKTRLFNFTGWSFDKNVPVPDFTFDNNEGIATFALRNSTSKLGIEADALNELAVETEGRDNRVATLYAIWDEYPTIEAVDRVITLRDAKDTSITQAEWIIEFLTTAEATDGDVGLVTDFMDGIITDKEEFTVINFDVAELQTFETSGSLTITYKAVDAVGNETYKSVTVHVIDENQQVEPDSVFFTRFISSKYYIDGNGNFVAESLGGLNEKSKWRTEAEYVALLTRVLNNKKDETTGEWTNEPCYTWNMSLEQINEAKAYIEANGIGNYNNANALANFYAQFKN